MDKSELLKEIKEIKDNLDTDIDDSNRILDEIKHVLSTMQMLSLNAGIEAAKAGVLGRGFVVIADHMTKSVDRVNNLTKEMTLLNENIQKASNLLDQMKVNLDE